MIRLLPDNYDPIEDLRPFSRIKLVALDIDGTLLESAAQREVASIIRRLARSLAHYRVKIVLATGRAFAGAEPMIGMLGGRSHNSIAITYNGAVVVNGLSKSISWQRNIPTGTVRYVHDVVMRHGFSMLTYECSPAVDQLLPALREKVFGYGSPLCSRPGLEFNGLEVNWQTSANEIVDSCAILIPTPHQRAGSEFLVQELDALPGISTTKSSDSYIEVRPADVTKAVALQRLAAATGLQQSEVAAVGDNRNDVEMLEWSGVGIAVGNGTAEAKEASNYICRRPSAQGVIEILRLIVQAHRYMPNLSSS